MPYKIDTQHIKLPKELDRRRKLTDDDRAEIFHYWSEWQSIRQLARDYNVSRRTIEFEIYPERLAKCKEQYKERRLDGRYYDKDEHREAMQKTRLHRKENLTAKKDAD